MIDNIHRTISTVFFLGYLTKAPGTLASFFASIFIYLWGPNVDILIIVTIILFFIGTYSSTRIEKSDGRDPSHVVIDEVVGIFITFTAVTFTDINFVIGFLLFRFFDIIKPLGIKRLQDLKGGFGIMLDDVLAGIYANIGIHLTAYIIAIYK